MKKTIMLTMIIIYSFAGSSFIHAFSMGFLSSSQKIIDHCSGIVTEKQSADGNKHIICYSSYKDQNINQNGLILPNLQYAISTSVYQYDIKNIVESGSINNKSPPIYRKNVKLNNFSDLIGIVKISIY